MTVSEKVVSPVAVWGRRILTDGEIVFDPLRREVTRDALVIRLTPRQSRLLQVLMERALTTLTRAELMRRVWDTEYTGDTRTLEVHVRWLREKIEENPSRPVKLVTVRGTGYRYDHWVKRLNAAPAGAGVVLLRSKLQAHG